LSTSLAGASGILIGIGDAVLIAKEGSGLTVQTWRNREPGFSALMLHRNEQPIDLLRPLAPPAAKTDTKVVVVPDPPPPLVEKRWYQKNWVRGSIAGGVIATIVGGILYMRRDQFLSVEPDSTWKDLR
jgi:hypothetical protein